VIDETPDPVLARRQQARRAASLAQRGGAALYGVAMVAFVAGFAAGFTDSVVRVVVGALAVGSLLLAPGILLAYAVRAAEREDRERGLPDR
jgi:hypothetical protein